MDPITMALVAALSTGLVSGITRIGESLVGDTYNAIKTALSKKFGSNGKVLEAVKELETNPKSTGAQEALSKSLAEKGANRDPELTNLAQKLIQSVNQINQQAGNQAIQIGQGNTVSGVVAQSFRGTVYNVNQAPAAPTAQDLLMRGAQLVRARCYAEAIYPLNQSLMATPSADANYYLALASIQGQPPRILTFSQATTIRQKLELACMLDPGKAHYWYGRALVEYDFFIENGFSENINKVEDYLTAGDACRFNRPFIVELLNHVPAVDCPVYRYLQDKLK